MQFTYSPNNKSEILEIKDNGKVIQRKNYHLKNGYSIYGVIEQALEEKCPSISFKI